MSRLEINSNEDFLEVSLPEGGQRVWQGCGILALTTFCVTALGIMALTQGDLSGKAGGEVNFLNPRGNHFGFLWVFGVIALGLLIPIYVRKVMLHRQVYRFDRSKGQFTLNGRFVARINRIEYVLIEHREDPDHRLLHKLSIVHTDGFHTPIDDWYDLDEIQYAAWTISEFLGARLQGAKLNTINKQELFSGDDPGST